ncbi:hypothetical protein E1B28_005090 [Marasmius oreades]|uniref:Uncharacterized protein n=1 Tax=Marasmius oreades TaxID=181124 RepID=A0A9P8ADY5_9AGAR|nr:uncharacterized protein E1B28_005090 [Marasmius oreades]KAG7097770.1 hypothetical protein E1B28_005090 [Marasmius oreades]
MRKYLLKKLEKQLTSRLKLEDVTLVSKKQLRLRLWWISRTQITWTTRFHQHLKKESGPKLTVPSPPQAIPAGDPIEGNGSSDYYNPDAVVDEEDLDDSGDVVDVAKSRNLRVKGGQQAALMLEKKKVTAVALSNTHTVHAPMRPNLKHTLPPLPLPSSEKAKHVPPKSALRSTWLEDSAVPVLNENNEADSFESPSGTVYQRSPSVMSGTGSFLSGYRSGAATSEGGTSTRAPSETGDMIITDLGGGIINVSGISSDEDGGLMEILNNHLTIQESSPMLKSKVCD